MVKNCRRCVNLHKSRGRNHTYWCGIRGREDEIINRGSFIMPLKQCRGEYYVERKVKL